MRIAIMGAGAVGGYFGGLLARAGEDVVFVARGDHLRALQEHGLRVYSVHGDFQLRVRATDDPSQIGPVDLVLFCVKSYDTVEAAHAVLPMVGPETAVLSIQNGVDNEQQIEAIVGPGHVLGGATQIESTVSEPGVIRQTSQLRRVLFCELDGRPTPRARRILEAMLRADIDARLTTDCPRTKWEKFIFLSSMAGMTSVCRATIGQVMADSEARAVLERAVREAWLVGRGLGVALEDNAVESVLEFLSKLPYGMKSSMQRDLERGRRLEVDALSGAVVRYGRKVGVDTPVHHSIYAALKLQSA